MEICDLVKYAHDNTLSVIKTTVQMILSAPQKDAKFKDNFMYANHEKFPFMFLNKYTSNEIVPKFIEIYGTKIKCGKEVNLLGITIDEKLRFDTHINNLCKKAAITRQINIIYRFKGIFDLKERKIIYNTFILSHTNYCPIMWHVFWKGIFKDN